MKEHNVQVVHFFPKWVAVMAVTLIYGISNKLNKSFRNIAFECVYLCSNLIVTLKD
jgi:hypothetical protein